MRMAVHSYFIDLYSEEIDWRSSSMFIYDPEGKITDEDIYKIIEYLYAEDFIKDRRIDYAIFKRKAP